MKEKVTDEMKKNLLGHLFYEVKMIIETKQMTLSFISQGAIGPPNMCVVAYLTHLRNLYDFFYGSKKSSMPRAAHYIIEWNKIPPKELERIKPRINWFLAHLSYHRTNKKFEPWNISWADHFKCLFIEFLKNIPRKYLEPSLKSQVGEWLKQNENKNPLP